jgi:uncharacterized protein (TIGR02453 family)
MKTKIEKSSFDFLKDLKKNNDRDWFNAHKERYLEEHGKITSFAESLLMEMNKHDVIETETGKKSLHRIYRDVRFSKDKTPYNTHWGGSFKRASKWRRGSYYFHLSPGNSFVAGGFWGPNPDDLKRIRDEFAFDPAPMRKVLADRKFKATFGHLEGEKIKTTPKGYSASDDAIDLLRYKQFLLVKKFSDKEVLDADFAKQASDTFKQMRPFLDYMSEILTTNLNGEKIA